MTSCQLISIPIPAEELSEVSKKVPRIFRLVEEQNIAELQQYLLEDREVNVARASDGWTPLLVAVQRNDLTSAALLLRHGADPNARTQDVLQDPILHYALNGEDNLDIIAMLLAAGADPNALSGNRQNTALMKAVTLERLDVVRVMLANDADVTAQALNGGTALLRARNAKTRELRELIEQHWQLAREKTAGKRKPMKLSKAERELFKALEAGNDAGARAILRQSPEEINPNAASANGVSLLMLAAYRGMPQIVRTLVELGANIHAGQDPPVLFFALKPENAPAIVKILLEYGADPNARRKRDDRTILMEAIAKNQPEIARLLLEAGARTDYADVTGATAHDLASDSVGTDWEALFEPYLVDPDQSLRPAALARAGLGGGSVDDAPTVDPAVYAAKKLEPNRHRLQLHLAVAQSDHLRLKELLDDGADVLSYSGRGRTALMSAAEQVDTEACRLLLEAGAEPNQLSRDDYRAPAIIYAASKKGSLSIVQLLHRKGAKLNAQMAGFGFTPLMLASALGEEETVRYLLANGARADMLAPDGTSAAGLAERAGHESIRQLLQSASRAER